MKPERIQVEYKDQTQPVEQSLLNPAKLLTKRLGRRIRREVESQPLQVRCMTGGLFGLIEGVLEVLAPETESKLGDLVLETVRDI